MARAVAMQLLLLTSTLLLYGCESVAAEQRHPHRSPHGHHHQSLPAAEAPRSAEAPAGLWPEMELVVARFAEQNLNWLAEFCDSYNTTIYNSGGDQHPMPATPDNCTWNVASIRNVGRETHSFATHLAERYDSLAPYAIFTQADPFRHRPKYLELLRHPSMLASVQTMSKLYKQDGHDGNRTPVDALEEMAIHPWFRSEFISLRTMESVWFHDDGVAWIEGGYRNDLGLAPATNLIHHYFGRIGLPDWVPKLQKLGYFPYGSMIGFERSKALQHPKEVYEKLARSSEGAHDPWVVERMWGMMFGGPEFRDILTPAAREVNTTGFAP